MTPLRFCLFTTFYPPYNFGGDGIDVQRTARALVARGHAVTVVHDVDAYQWLSGKRPPMPSVDQDGVEVIGLRSRAGVLTTLLTHQIGRPVWHGDRIRHLLDERRPDVVVFNNISLVGGPGLLDFGGDALKVYVAHEHWLVCPTHVLWRFNREPCDRRRCTACVLAYRRPPQVWRYTDALERRLGQVDLFIARSEFSRKKHAEFGFTPPMEVLPYFLPADFGSQPVPHVDERPHPRPYFLFVGRLTSIKGLDSVIPAFRDYPDADLLVIGDGEELGPLQRQAQGMSNVLFLGRIENRLLERFYRHAVASIAPSKGFETFGIVLIESFRFRTPVIARDIGPFPEIVEQSSGGLLFDDAGQLRTAMGRIQGDAGLRDTLADNGYRAFEQHWSEQVVIDRYLDLVTSRLEAGPRVAR